jgi:hypothetical protein
MKKRYVVILTLCLLLLITGLVYATGSVRIFVNGQEIYSDVPPQIINGRTMVPIRFVAEALGANVQWDEKTQAVSIINTAEDDMKLYSKIYSHYRDLEKLGINLQNLSNGLTINAFAMISLNDDSVIDTTNNIADGYINTYNDLLQPTQNLINEASYRGMDISDMNTILNDYYDVIDYYKMAVNSCYKYYDSRSQADYNKFIDYVNKVYNTSGDGQTDAKSGYNTYYRYIQNY